MYNKKSSFFIREFGSFISYLLVGGFSCALAFFIVIQFLNPALSENQNRDHLLLAENKSSSTKKTLEGIKNNFVGIVKQTFSDESKKLKEVQERVPPNNQLPPSGEVPPNNQLPPSGEVPPNNQLPPSGEVPPNNQLPPSGEVPPNKLGEVPPNNQLPPSGEVPPNKLGEVPPNNQLPPSGEVPPNNQLPSSEELSATEGQSPVSEVEIFMTPFIYDPEHRRDPFEDPTILQSAGSIVFAPRTPPEEYDLNQLQLKGIIWDIKSPKALFQLPGIGGFYTLLRGDKIGKNGTIFEIREDEVVIVETIFKAIGSDKISESDIKIIKLDRLKL